LSLALACGDDDENPTIDAGDAGERDANDGVCDVDDDCDDRTFCNGAERCMPSASGADARGCVAGTSPCEDGCDEPANECVSCTEPDADGDGFGAIACGGDDCDDGDEDVSPDASEICDPEGFDEDCNPGTFGSRDDDGDGLVDARCCNGDLCGTDCDDGDDAVRPDAIEVCNRRDDDCDGSLDEIRRRTRSPAPAAHASRPSATTATTTIPHAAPRKSRSATASTTTATDARTSKRARCPGIRTATATASATRARPRS
jgi:hypothetical protein